MLSSVVLIVLLHCLSFISSARAAHSEDWRRRSVYQLLTDRFARTNDSDNSACNVEDYCGGTFQGIINHLDWVQDMGFTAVWISPIQKGLEGDTPDGADFHGYWITDFLAVNEHFGTAQDIINLANELHKRGMFLMFDIAVMGMALIGATQPGATYDFTAAGAVDYSVFVPFNSSEYFHPYCVMDYSNETSCQTCWFGDDNVAIAHLNPEVPFVNNWLDSWIQTLISNYSVDGLRIDALKHMPQPFWGGFQNSSNSFLMGEEFDQSAGLICPYQQYVTAMFNYPLYPAIYGGFGSTNASLAPIPSTAQSNNQSGCTDSGLLGTFIENADLSRYWNETSDTTLGKNAITYVILAEGIPFVYQGFETLSNGAYPNYNRNPLWPNGWKATDMSTFVGTLNKFRNGVINKDGDVYLKGGMSFVYTGGNAVAFKRGPILVFLTNGGSEAENLPIQTENTNFEQGTVLTEILSGGNVTVGSQGVVSVTLTKGMPQVYYPLSEFASVTATTVVSALTPITTVGGTAGGVTSGVGGPSASASANSTGKKSAASGRMGGEIHMWIGIFTIFVAFLGGLMIL